MRRLFLAIGLVLIAAACSDEKNDNKETGELSADDAWVRATVADGAVTGAFMILSNSTGKDETLVNVSVGEDVAGTVEIHETTVGENEVMQMRPVEGGVVVPADGNTVLKPGGYHIMLLDMKTQLQPGDTVTLTLTFESGAELTIEAEVRAMETTG